MSFHPPSVIEAFFFVHTPIQTPSSSSTASSKGTSCSTGFWYHPQLLCLYCFSPRTSFIHVHKSPLSVPAVRHAVYLSLLLPLTSIWSSAQHSQHYLIIRSQHSHSITRADQPSPSLSIKYRNCVHQHHSVPCYCYCDNSTGMLAMHASSVRGKARLRQLRTHAAIPTSRKLHSPTALPELRRGRCEGGRCYGLQL